MYLGDASLSVSATAPASPGTLTPAVPMDPAALGLGAGFLVLAAYLWGTGKPERHKKSVRRKIRRLQREVD